MQIGLKPGVRAKYFGHDWEAARFDAPLPPEEVFDAIRKVETASPLERHELPEAASVWNEKAFAKKKDLFAVGGFFAVKGKMAEILSGCDLGEGGLVPMPLYKDDLETPWPEPCWFINFGGSKDCFLSAESKNLYLHGPSDRPEEDKFWSFHGSEEHEAIAVAPAALQGADLWIERQLRGQIFMSGKLARAVKAAKVKPTFPLQRVKIAGDA